MNPWREEAERDELSPINTGAIDPLDEIAYFCEHHKLGGWSEDDSSFDWDIKPLVRVQSSWSLPMSPPSEAPHSLLLP